MVLRMCLRMGEHLGAERERIGVRLAGAAAAAHDAGARQRVLELLADGMVRGKGEAAREAGVSAGVDRRPDRRGHAAKPWCCRRSRSRKNPIPISRNPNSRRTSSAAAAALKATLAKGGYSVTLLDGVTGSGKTEVYFEAVADTIRRGRQSLILMPEIALTAQFLDRFAARFGVRPAEWHSRTVAAPARAHLARGRRRRSLRRGRRALGAVSALRRSRPHRRR